MKCITMVSRKGGVGKTTIACALACKAAARGHKVAVIDCDPGLESAFDFFELRGKDDVVCVRKEKKSIHDLAVDFNNQGFDYCFIDIGGFDAADTRLAATFSSLLILPFVPSGGHYRGLLKTIEIINSVGEAGARVAPLRILVTKAKRNTVALRAAQSAVENIGVASLKTVLHESVDYDNADLHRMSVVEFKSNQAAGEISRLLTEIEEVMK